MADDDENLPEYEPDPPPPLSPLDPNWKPTPRDIVWHKGVTDEVPVPPHLSPNAVYFGLDTGTRDVFVHAASLDLEMLELARAHGTGPGHCIFANPSRVGSTDEAFVTIDYLARTKPDLVEDYGLHEIRQRVRATFARSRQR